MTSSKINFSLTQFEYVLAVSRLGHFAKAAESCHVTQPTLSMQIQKLEEDLGVVLFDRSKKPVLMTEIGKKVVEQIQTVVFEARKIQSLIQSEKKTGIHGELIVGVIPTLAPYLMPRLLPFLEQRFPDLSLRIQELQTDRILEALDNDQIDVGILATPLHDPKVFELPLFYEPFYLLCRNELSPKDQKRMPPLNELKRVKYSALSLDQMWLLEEGHCLRNQVIDICAVKREKKQKKTYQFDSGSIETLKNLVNSYGGYTLIPQLAMDHIGEKTKLIPFERPIPAREIGLVYRRQHFKNELIESLSEAILESLPPEVRKIRLKDLNVIPLNLEK